METDVVIAYGIKMYFINIYTYYILVKILNYSEGNRKIGLLIVSTIIAIICTLIRYYTNSLISVTVLFLLFNMYIITINRNQIKTSLFINTIAFAICFLLLGISIMLSYVPYKSLSIESEFVNLVIILIIEALLVAGLFKIKRFQKGLEFLKNENENDFIEIFMICISTIIILIYCLLSGYNSNSIIHLVIAFIILGIIMFIMIQKTLILYYKQKLLEKTIQEYKEEISEKDKHIQELSDEKFKISKVNHEFYNRQKALKLAVQEFVSNSKVETANEITVMDKINNLSKEYSSKIEAIKSSEKLPITGIEEIDDMFKYMQSECIHNNIDFNLNINGNIFYMINNLIDKNRLVTLIGDHLRDSIIAINFSTNKYKSIIAFLGIKDNCYEFSVYDTGIEFEIDTLLKLGLKPITTHKDSGGTGIGFITTFETMKETRSSLIIEEKHEIMNNDYTKSVTIRFDNNNEYKIKSYRADEIKKKSKDDRIIIEEA